MVLEHWTHVKSALRQALAYGRRARWVRWALPLLIAALFVWVERQRVSTQSVARYEDFFAFVERAVAFDPANLGAFNWVHGLYPLGYPLLLWSGVQLGLDALTTSFVLSSLGGALGLLGTFALVQELSDSYALALLSEFSLACVGYYLYYGSLESTDMLAAGMLIVALATLLHAGPRWRGCLAAGLLVGVSYLVRYTAVVTVLLCALYLFTLAVKRRDRAWGTAGGAFVLGALLGALPQLLASTLVKGNPLYTTQAHNLWFTLLGSTDYIYEWYAMPMEMSMLDVFRQFPREVASHWWLEFRNFWMTSDVNFLGKPFYALLQAGFLFTVLWRDGLRGQARFFVACYVVGSLALFSLMRLDPRYLIALMPLFVFGVVYFVWQLTPQHVQLGRRALPLRGLVMLVLMAWAANHRAGFMVSNIEDVEVLQVSRALHAAGLRSFQEVFSTELYLQDVADPWKRRFSVAALAGPRFETHEQLAEFVARAGYRFFIYGQASAAKLYPALADQPFLAGRSIALSPVFVPESKKFVVYRVVSAGGAAYPRLDVSLADGFRLAGYEIVLDETQPPGQPPTLGVYLYWQVERATSRQLKVFVHVTNERGELIGQDDSEPQMWLYPTNAWQAGESVCDFHLVELGWPLPAGEYAVRVGLYDPASGERLAVLDPGGLAVIDDAIVLTSLTIQ